MYSALSCTIERSSCVKRVQEDCFEGGGFLHSPFGGLLFLSSNLPHGSLLCENKSHNTYSLTFTKHTKHLQYCIPKDSISCTTYTSWNLQVMFHSLRKIPLCLWPILSFNIDISHTYIKAKKVIGFNIFSSTSQLKCTPTCFSVFCGKPRTLAVKYSERAGTQSEAIVHQKPQTRRPPTRTNFIWTLEHLSDCVGAIYLCVHVPVSIKVYANMTVLQIFCNWKPVLRQGPCLLDEAFSCLMCKKVFKKK